MNNIKKIYVGIGIVFVALIILLISLLMTRPFSNQVTVLAYHHISNQDLSNVTVTPALFENQLAFLQKKGFQFVSLKQFKAFMNGGSVPNKAVLVTFDDGYESFYMEAYPILQRLHIPAVNFDITGTLDDPKSHKIAYLSKEEIRKMTQGSDSIEVACHSDHMHGFDRYGTPLLISHLNRKKDQYQTDIIGDTALCINKLNDFSSGPVDTYAYPFGGYDRAAIVFLKKAGIQYGFSGIPSVVRQKGDPMEIPRINAGNPNITPAGLYHSILKRSIISFLRHLF